MDTHMEVLDAPVEKKKDKGFTLVELLIVIVILGILSTVTVFAVRGITDRGQSTTCQADKKVLNAAVEAYFAQTGQQTIATAAYAATAINSTNPNGNQAQTTAIAAPAGITQGATPIATLVTNKFLNSTSKYFFIKPDGSMVHITTSCGTTYGAAA